MACLQLVYLYVTQPCLHTLMPARLSTNQSVRTILVILELTIVILGSFSFPRSLGHGPPCSSVPSCVRGSPCACLVSSLVTSVAFSIEWFVSQSHGIVGFTFRNQLIREDEALCRHLLQDLTVGNFKSDSHNQSCFSRNKEPTIRPISQCLTFKTPSSFTYSEMNN